MSITAAGVYKGEDKYFSYLSLFRPEGDPVFYFVLRQ